MELPIPIRILKKGETIPRETCYLITRDGVFLQKFNGLVESLVKVEGICFLESVKPKAKLHLPKIPIEVMAQALAFFGTIHEQLGSEINLLLHYRPKGRPLYQFSCPVQEVTAASVDYEAAERLEGYQLVGTVHSHNTMSAFHSSTDQTDESFFDGLHITVGKVDRFPRFSISCSIMVNSQRFKIEPEEMINGLAIVKEVEPRKDWVAEVGQAVEYALAAPFATLESFRELSPGVYSEWRPQLYELFLPKGKSWESVVFPVEWLDKVKKRVFYTSRERGFGSRSPKEDWGYEV